MLVVKSSLNMGHVYKKIKEKMYTFDKYEITTIFSQYWLGWVLTNFFFWEKGNKGCIIKVHISSTHIQSRPFLNLDHSYTFVHKYRMVASISTHGL